MIPWPKSLTLQEGRLELTARSRIVATSKDLKPLADILADEVYLATGRRLVITSDHGYAATGYFPDADGDVGQFLKKTFASGRSAKGVGETGPFVPPVALQINSPHGAHLLAVGRWKWKSQGGYPTLTHGGLSLLEVLSPFVELTK